MLFALEGKSVAQRLRVRKAGSNGSSRWRETVAEDMSSPPLDDLRGLGRLAGSHIRNKQIPHIQGQSAWLSVVSARRPYTKHTCFQWRGGGVSDDRLSRNKSVTQNYRPCSNTLSRLCVAIIIL